MRWLVGALLVVGCGSEVQHGADAGQDGGHPADAGADSGPAPTVLAPPGDTAMAGPVDGIHCDTSEQLLFHIHAHLAIFAEGEEKLLAAGIGIGPPLQKVGASVVSGSCFSWLHTHDESGVIHIESPVDRTYTLGNFFDIWGLPLSTSQVGPEHGKVTAYLNDTQWVGDPRKIPLDAHNVIQLDVGKPVVPFRSYSFPPGL